ncbi:MAG: Rpn family recombination-promoting nuclease/putative transposase, partial [Magnetococcales bacterium]|nr:Rpn family recombination-promoting nuclease/putative transposase [Magnetococcales bacterium]
MADHDGAYHQMYTDPLMVADLLVHFVDEPWVKELDFARMQRVNAKFHNRLLPKREGDVIWQIPMHSGGELYLLAVLE